MKIVEVKTENLIEYAFNNRVHSPEQIDRIANSIREFGFNQPIVIDEENIVLVGHGRLAAAKKLNLLKVPVVQLVDLSETQKRAYRILDNKLQNDSEWNYESLQIELDRLSADNFPIESWGLTDLSALLTAPEKPQPKDFESFNDSISVDHECPKCGYQWSGNSKPKAKYVEDEDNADDES